MSAKRTKATIKPGPCNISGEMGEKISGLLERVGIQPAQLPPPGEEGQEPVPLILPDEKGEHDQETERPEGLLGFNRSDKK